MTYKHKNEGLLISSFFHLAIVSVDIYVVRIESKSFFERMKLRHSNYFTMSKPCRDSLTFGGFDINGHCVMLEKIQRDVCIPVKNILKLFFILGYSMVILNPIKC